MLRDVLNVVNEGDTLPDTLRGLLNVFIGTFGARGGAALWYDDAHRRWRIAAHNGAIAAGQLVQRLNAHERIPSDVAQWAERTYPLCAWLRGQQHLLGAFVLDEKLAGEPFSAEDRALLTEALQEASTAIENSKLLELARIKDRFLLRIAHELGKPLTAVASSLDLLLSGHCGEMTDDQREWMSLTHQTVQPLQRLVSDLLDLTRADFGRLELQRQPVKMSDAIHRAVTTLQAQAQARDTTIRVNAPPALPSVDADPNRLYQILLNLLSNAVKYSHDSGEVQVVSRRQGSTLITSVSDNGIGIKKADQLRLFEEFFRADNAKVRGIEGTGLGLAITKRLVELHGGNIWFESALRKGSTFYFSLPLPRQTKVTTER
jgi:signal transduction histidine kinase